MGAAQAAHTYEAEEVRALAWKARPARRVELAYTQFGPGLPGAKAYHTSIILQDKEYSFGRLGVVQAPPFSSHSFLTREHQVMVVGHTTLTGEEMAMVLHPYFRQGSYDMMHKNCNSFTDVSLYLLLGQRLNPAFRDLERAGYVAERAFNFVQAITGGTYRPNPAASKFDIEHVIYRICDEKRRMGLK